MSYNVIPFRYPYLPLEGAERLAARRMYREACKSIASEYVAKAFAASSTTPATGKLGCDDALPVFVAAMRRELRKTGLF